MNTSPRPRRGWLRSAALLIGLASALSAAPAKDADLLGRWALTIPGGAAGWLELEKKNGWYDGSILWGGGSVLPVANVVIADGVATVTRVREVQRKDASGKVIRTQQVTETITARAEGDTLKLTRVAPRGNSEGFDRAEFTGKRIPALPSAPNLSKVKFGEPISLLNGRDLSGWSLKEKDMPSAWKIKNGALVNEPAPQVDGQPKVRYANLRTDREFEDFNLKLEVNIPQGSNSGIYLRGIYEVQVFDSYQKPLDSHHMGAIYSRIVPAVAAEKPPGEWQTLDITLVDRHATVILNGKTIIDNAPLEGVTGGAMWSDQFRPGPLYLQGDHGAVSYRNIVIRPVVK
ncbi:MAG TPA: DUF1080 domain-containing protein [Opitutaceae bacterium]|nr:DUF1080 domain-containing protein [Opitutaceae bacterium]